MRMTGLGATVLSGPPAKMTIKQVTTYTDE